MLRHCGLKAIVDCSRTIPSVMNWYDFDTAMTPTRLEAIILAKNKNFHWNNFFFTSVLKCHYIMDRVFRKFHVMCHRDEYQCNICGDSCLKAISVPSVFCIMIFLKLYIIKFDTNYLCWVIPICVDCFMVGQSWVMIIKFHARFPY